MSTLRRIKEYIVYKGISNKRFEESVGFSNGAFASQLKNNRTIGVDKLENILLEYTDVSAEWLLTGKGNMLLSGEEKAVSGLEKTQECKKCEALKEKIDFLEQLNKAKDDTIKAYQKSDCNCDCNSDSKRTSA
jgi:hypothetical protein